MTNGDPLSFRLPIHTAVTDLLDRFEAAWQAGTVPHLEEFLSAPEAPSAGPPRRRLLQHLVQLDLEYRWRQPDSGNGAGPLRSRLEEYTAAFPELTVHGDLLMELIAHEYRVRRCWSTRPSHDEYVQRFSDQGPDLGEALRRIDAELGAELDGAAFPPLPPPALPPGVPDQIPASVADLTTTIRDLQLLSAAQLNDWLLELCPRFPDPTALAHESLNRGWLTAYQVEKLLQGRGADLVLGSYQVLERLGEGGTGWVFKAQHRNLDRLVVLKVLRPEFVADAEVRGRFEREMRLISRLDHPHVTRAYDAGPIGSRLVLVMEYAPGIDLNRLVKQSGPLPIEQVCTYVRQAALGLQHIHEHGLVHRDLKPSNLFVDRRVQTQPVTNDRRQTGDAEPVSVPPSPWGRVKTLDLGLGRLREGATGRAQSSAQLTATGAMLLGTPDFLAPEQALDFHAADIRADLYSLGCTLFFLLTGKAPFADVALAEKLMCHQQADPPSLRSLRPELPAELAAVVRRLLAKRPENRYQAPAELANALEPWCRVAPESVVSKVDIDATSGHTRQSELVVTARGTRADLPPTPRAPAPEKASPNLSRAPSARRLPVPPSAPHNVAQFLEYVQKSGLLALSHAETQLIGETPASPQAAARALVKAGRLTGFQAEQLLQGRWRNFFVSGKYKVLDKLGAGGMATVYLCEHQEMGHKVALKVLPSRQSDNPAALQRFKREARAVAALHHPNVVSAHDVGTDGPLHYLVMEYVEGTDLQQLVKMHGPLDPIRACHYIRQAALGLQHAFEHGLVHRDIKPGNLLVDRAGTVKILDMGLARFFYDEHDDLTKQMDGGVVLGTADYLAPEQAVDSHQADIRADIYSLGATFYYLLAGRAPFAEGTMAQKLLWHQMRKVPSVRETRPEVPEGVAAVMTQMLAKEPAERYQTPVAVAEALASWTVVPLPPPDTAEMPRPVGGSGSLGAMTPEAVPMSPAPLSQTYAETRGFSQRAEDGADSVLGLPSSGRRPRRHGPALAGLVALLMLAFGSLGTVLWWGLTRGNPEPSIAKLPIPEPTRPVPTTAPLPDGIVDDFRKGLGAWEVKNATADGGIVRLAAPPGGPAEGILRRKVSGFKGDFTVSADLTQLGQLGGDWRDSLTLSFGSVKITLQNGGRTKLWGFYTPPAKEGRPLGDIARHGSVVNEPRTFKICRRGTKFTFSVVYREQQVDLAYGDYGDLGPLTEVALTSSVYGAPLSVTVANFRLEKGAGPPSR